MINMQIPPPNVTANPPGAPGPVPVALMHLNGQNPQGIPGHSGPGGQSVHQFGPTGPPHMMGGERMPMPHEAQAMYDPMAMPDEELSPGSGEYRKYHILANI